MLTMEGCLARRERLWASVPDDVEWLLIADPRHVQYLANFWVQPLSFSGGERGLLLLERSDGATLLADNFAARSAVHEPFIDREELHRWYDHRHSVENRDHALVHAARAIAGKLKGRQGLVETEWLPVAVWEALGRAGEPDAAGDSEDAVDLGTLLRELRRRKEPDEVDLLRTCMRAGDAGQARLREIIREGITDFEVYREIQNAALAEAGRPGLVYGDFRASTAHNPKTGGLPVGDALQHGDLFVLDFSVVLDGYRSDFTNTMSVGHPSSQQVMLFDLCLAAMAAGESALAAGVRARDVHRAVFKVFADAGYGDAFPHHAGHGIGLAHPEPPILVPESDDELLEGDVLTLEPGAYVEGIGGMRIEHNYLITANGYERLSNHDISLT